MLTKITEPETFERDGKPFTKQVFMSGTTTINLVRPVLTPEEYEARRLEVEKAAIDLLKSAMEKEKTASVPDGSFHKEAEDKKWNHRKSNSSSIIA